LAAYIPSMPVKNEVLSVYIEGDGLAWLTRSQVSTDPTPLNPIGLELALRHSKGTAVYLARPCQYVQGADSVGCKAGYWTKRRFSAEIVSASSLAIDQLKQMFGATKIVLVGYSGGGAIAALLAAKRSDVIQLVTVAGNLDHVAWTSLHHISPLDGSLNPSDAWEALQAIPQLHFVGEKDQNVSVQVINAYLARFPLEHQPTVRVVKDFDHICCWKDQWAALSQQF